MKKIYMIMTGILTIVLAVLLVTTVFQIKKGNSVKNQMAELRKEVKELEQQAKEKESGRQKLEKELVDATEKRDTAKQEEEAAEEQEAQEESIEVSDAEESDIE